MRAQGLDRSAMTHIPDPPAVLSLSASRLLPSCSLSVQHGLSNYLLQALQPALRTQVSLDQDQHGGCWPLLWNSPSSLKMRTFAHSVSSGLAPYLSPGISHGGLAGSCQALSNLFSRLADESSWRGPINTPSISATLPVSAFLSDHPSSERKPPATDRSPADPLAPGLASQHSPLSVFRLPSLFLFLLP